MSENSAWDKFVTDHPKGTLCHLTGYAETLKETFGYEPVYFRFTRGDRLIGVWPFSLVRGSRLISMPFYEFGGPLWSEDASGQEIEEGISTVQQYARTHKIKDVELRAALGLSDQESSHYQNILMCPYALLPLGDAQKIYKETLDYQVRKAVQKAQRSGLTVTENHEEDFFKKNFYPLYLKHMKTHLGAPPMPQQFFLGFLRHLKNVTKVFYVTHESKIISALMGFAVGKRIYIAHAPMDTTYRDLRPSDLMHWAFVEWGCNNGFKYFDFGNARYKGQKDFKTKWGCSFSDYKRYFLKGVSETPAPAPVNPDQLHYKIASSVWKSAVPLFITEPLGKIIHKVLTE